MARLAFYLAYAAKNLRRSGQWTTFAVFCVAAGVATVVALRSLGLAITDSLLSNLRQYNHGDINLSIVRSYGPFAVGFQGGDEERLIYQPQDVDRVRGWVNQRGGEMTAYALVTNIQVTPIQQSNPRPQFSSSLFIDPASFAAMYGVVALDPPGVPIDQLLTAPNHVLISQNMADANNIRLGDEVRVSGTEERFVVRGIVPTEAESNVENLFAAFFGFAYFNIHTAPAKLGLNPNPNTLGVNLPGGTSSAEIERAGAELSRLVFARELRTTPYLLRRNQELSDMVGRFIVAMGLGAMLIGGVGIMNTMLVLVGRRTMEIASLKTFGLKGRQVAAMFIAEAFLLGVMGSLAGVIVGLLLTGAVNQYGEAFLQQPLPWKIYPEAIVYGLGLGLIVTLVFGVLPVLTATKIRPGIILRPNETHLPRAGCLQSLAAMGVIVMVLGVIAGQILAPLLETASNVVDEIPSNPYLMGILGVTLTLLFLALLTGLLWVVVWLVGRLPTFGWVDLRLAFRNLSTQRTRTATTLLALTAGMFALSSITYFGLGAREVVRFQFAQTFGGNVMIIPLLPRASAQPVIDLALALQPGIQYKTILNLSGGRIVRLDGQDILVDGERQEVPLSILTRDSDNPALNSGPVLQGRDLTPDDRGRRVIVLSERSLVETLLRDYTLEELGIQAGSIVRLRMAGQEMDFEVVGIVGSASSFTPNIAGAYVPPDLLTANYQINVVQVQPDLVDDVLVNMSTVPLVFAVDVAFLDGLLRRLIEQLAAVPTIVGLLSLLAAAVIMANTVALAILERRRQIGILKAIGLKRGRVLRVMLLENTIVGLLGGLLGIGVSSLGVSLMTALGTGFTLPVPSEASLITVVLIIASVLIAWLATLLSARVAIRERVLRILRYE